MVAKKRKTNAKAKAKPKPKPKLLSGGNPQIAKGYGNAPVKAWLAAIPGWKKALGRRLDALIVRNVPGVAKAVKWNTPFYGFDGKGWFVAFHCFTNYIKVTFFRGTSLDPVPAGRVETPGSAIPRHSRRRARRSPVRRMGEAGQRFAGRKNVGTRFVRPAFGTIATRLFAAPRARGRLVRNEGANHELNRCDHDAV